MRDDRRAIVVVLNDNSRVRVGINGAWEDEERERTKLGGKGKIREGGNRSSRTGSGSETESRIGVAKTEFGACCHTSK